MAGYSKLKLRCSFGQRAPLKREHVTEVWNASRAVFDLASDIAAENGVANEEQLERLKKSPQDWNEWRVGHKAERIDLLGADLTGVNLTYADLSDAHLVGARFSNADLTFADFRRANLSSAIFANCQLIGANLTEANLFSCDLTEAELTNCNLSNAILSGSHMDRANFSLSKIDGAKLTNASMIGAKFISSSLVGAQFWNSNLRNADFSSADVSHAEFQSANLDGANFRDADIKHANIVDVRWDIRHMRGRFGGTHGLESVYGNALFKRDAQDQDYLDSLEWHWREDNRRFLFRAWGLLEYGRSISRVAAFGFGLAGLFGLIYAVFPNLLTYEAGARTWFSPFYFSIVTFTTLGFGDIRPQGVPGQILVTIEVIVGYITLGLLLAVLAQNIARRS